MKTITHAKLMQKVDDGAAEINAWSEENGKPIADVTFHTMRSSKREYVAVTGKAAVLAEHDRATLTMMRNMVSRRPSRAMAFERMGSLYAGGQP